MALRGSFQAAKKVALALHNLITSQYPKDYVLHHRLRGLREGAQAG